MPAAPEVLLLLAVTEALLFCGVAGVIEVLVLLLEVLEGLEVLLGAD